ncbi:hypothetical protein [Breoghania sp.]|uniref:hypothetical protein n=1 Tax=Breoghania sp. TaxID=2065378 RepID=UPI00262B50B0|nr:hypothetical protein [Breoghania sp.]MDJ0931312.1 hypothetical protein [Breoghania sp.]
MRASPQAIGVPTAISEIVVTPASFMLRNTGVQSKVMCPVPVVSFAVARGQQGRSSVTSRVIRHTLSVVIRTLHRHPPAQSGQ